MDMEQTEVGSVMGRGVNVSTDPKTGLWVIGWDWAAVEDQTSKHLSALDAELEQAVKGVERTGGWVLKKSTSGGSYVYNQRGGSTYHLPDDVAECFHAFLSGDLLTALQKRDEIHEALPVAP